MDLLKCKNAANMDRRERTPHRTASSLAFSHRSPPRSYSELSAHLKLGSDEELGLVFRAWGRAGEPARTIQTVGAVSRIR